MYLWFSFAMFLLGGVFALVIRAELFEPGMQIVDPEFFNQMTTMHGLVMVFGAIMPAFVGLANWLVPMMIGAPDMALPRMNNLEFLDSAFRRSRCWLRHHYSLEGVSARHSGWTFYAPLSTTFAKAGTGDGFLPMTIFHLRGTHSWVSSSVMGAINIIATILNMRAPGMTLYEDAAVRMDLADYCLPAGSGDAGTGGRGDHDADGCSRWHQLL